MLEQFVEYYKPHKRKFVYYWYDHTAVGEQHDSKICDDVQNYLRKAGWIIRPMYTNKAPAHEIKYRMNGDILTENSKYKKVLRINRENCDKLILSMCYAQAEQRKDGFGMSISIHTVFDFMCRCLVSISSVLLSILLYAGYTVHPQISY